MQEMYMTSKISVVICAYTAKRLNELCAAIASVQGQTLSPREIIVVIDHNPVLLQQVQEKCADVVVIENSRGKGLSGARNSGWEMAGGEIVVFLDDDAFAAPDWLEKLALCYADPAIAGVGGKLVPHWETCRPSWFPEEFNWTIGCTYRGMPTENARVRNVIGANMSVRKNVLLAAGGFRESFGCDKDTNTARRGWTWLQHYAGDEETELCIRVSQQAPDRVWLYTPAAVVQHRVSLERTRRTYFIWRCYDEGLGKANLVKLHTVQTGLSSEKTYTFKTLPEGVMRGLADVFLQHDLTGISRALAIVVGLVMTMLGYLIGSVASRLTPASDVTLAPAQYPLVIETSSSVDVQ